MTPPQIYLLQVFLCYIVVRHTIEVVLFTIEKYVLVKNGSNAHGKSGRANLALGEEGVDDRRPRGHERRLEEVREH